MSQVTKKNMPYVRLGNSGLKVSRIILGCMSYGSPVWAKWVLEEEEAIKHIRFAYEHGINAFDTANVYSDGRSEEILGKAIKEIGMNRDEIVVMTKVYFWSRREVQPVAAPSSAEKNSMGYVNQYGLSRKNIFASVKASLERLGLDYIDVLQCHRFDHDTPVEETMQALHDVVKAGYVRYIGMSSCHAYQFHIMQNYAINNNLTPFISMQNHHSLLYREEEREMVPTLKHFKVGMIPWAPLAEGILTRPYGRGSTLRSNTDQFQKGHAAGLGTEAVVKRVQEIAEKKGTSMAQVALAWSMARTTAPIVGTTSLKNLEDSINAVNVSLSDEEIKLLEEPYVPRSIMGHS